MGDQSRKFDPPQRTVEPPSAGEPADLRSWHAGLFGVFEWDLTSGNVVWDSASVAMFGLETQEPPSYRTWETHLLPEDRDRLEAYFRNWIASDRREEHWEFRFQRPDGDLRWISARGILFRDLEGHPVRVIGTNQDVTRLKQAERAMLSRQEDFETMFNLLPAQIWYKDTRNGIVRVNDKVCRDLGMTHEQIEGHATDEIFPLFAEEYYRADLEVITTGRPKLGIEEQINTARGDLLWIRTDKVPVKDAQGRVTGVLAIVSDLTDQKKTEEYLRREADRSKVLLELYEKAKRLTDDELYEFALDQAVKLSGSKVGFLHLVSDDQQNIELKVWNRKTLEGCTAGGETHYPLERAGNWADCVRQRHPVVYNNFGTSPNQKGIPEGHIPLYRFMSVPVMDDGKVKIVIGVGNKEQDYNESDLIHIQLLNNELQKVVKERRAEKALKEAKEAAEAANSAKDKFLAVLSHELRTPLTPVLALASALESQEDLRPEFREDMNVIRRNVEIESKLIDDLLDVTRIIRGSISLHPEVVDITAVLRTALEICQKQIDTKRLEIATDFQASARHVRGDLARLRQVFWNLIKNSVEYTPDGGRICLRTSNVDHRLRIEISDTGMGFGPELLPRIFNAFERGSQTATRRIGGLGLGLNIVKSVVELHQGSVTAYSAGEGKGATFTVDLPSVVAAREPEARPVAPAPSRRPRKILVVDDHRDTLNTLAKLLRRWGYTVVTADSVRSALEAASRESFDLLLSDLGLADGSGLEIMRAVKEKGLRGIAFSGYGTEEDLRKSREAGFEEHLTKPISFEALRAAVERITA